MPTIRATAANGTRLRISTANPVDKTLPIEKYSGSAPVRLFCVMMRTPVFSRSCSVEHVRDVVDHDAFLLGAQVVVADSREYQAQQRKEQPGCGVDRATDCRQTRLGQHLADE